MEISPAVQNKLDSIPQKTGCYLMKNANGEIIYVGKAVNLRSRVRSYFHANSQKHPRTRQLVRRIADIEWIIVGSELEALILEMNLIKKHRPRYNVRLKDDKRYPYIKVHWSDPYPKVSVTRQTEKDGSRYYGPYTSVWAVNQTLDVLRRVFPYLTCNRTITGEDQRACLYYDIELCAAPCTGAISKEDYRGMIDKLGGFLNGRTEPIVNQLQEKMSQASDELRFEKAAQIRDQLQAIKQIVERQRIISPKYFDSDVIAMARSEKEACVQIFFVRGGKLTGREYFMVEGTNDMPDAKVLSEAIKQFYVQSPAVPSQILLPRQIEEARIIKQWLNSQRGGEKVEFLLPREQDQKELIEMVAENASAMLAALKTQENIEQKRKDESLNELQEYLKLSEPPQRIECYDISTMQGTAQVGSMVVFHEGMPHKNHYRRFNIRTVSGQDDFASMEEVLTRRFKRWEAAQEEQDKPGKKPDASFATLPNLLLVDGGKGQLSRAVQVLEEFNLLDTVPVAGLAKRHEEVFVPGRMRPIILPRNSQGLYLLQRVRDEAHRFAITAHRKRRSRQGLQSGLEKIPGVGPIRRRALLQRFHTIQNIRQASVEELAETPKITKTLARTIKKYLK
ncbi:MAG: excinuclease ABC subunit C [Anaerolineaceae bacterium 4572_5.1]|nr:MAG: excinuclease ABC subunit C [Anaerolineaceae bacterium 4572_5.1]